MPKRRFRLNFRRLGSRPRSRLTIFQKQNGEDKENIEVASTEDKNKWLVARDPEDEIDDQENDPVKTAFVKKRKKIKDDPWKDDLVKIQTFLNENKLNYDKDVQEAEEQLMKLKTCIEKLKNVKMPEYPTLTEPTDISEDIAELLAFDSSAELGKITHLYDKLHVKSVELDIKKRGLALRKEEITAVLESFRQEFEITEVAPNYSPKKAIAKLLERTSLSILE